MKGCLNFLPWAMTILALAIIAVSIYCVAIIWALNFIFHLGIGMFDLWAWLAIIILTGIVRGRK